MRAESGAIIRIGRPMLFQVRRAENTCLLIEVRLPMVMDLPMATDPPMAMWRQGMGTTQDAIVGVRGDSAISGYDGRRELDSFARRQLREVIGQHVVRRALRPHVSIGEVSRCSPLTVHSAEPALMIVAPWIALCI
jgi:hypothetical protein